MTNEDAFTTTTKGRRVPGNGSAQAILRNMLQNSKGDGLICEKVVTGKPNPEILNIIRSPSQASVRFTVYWQIRTPNRNDAHEAPNP